MEGIAVLLPVYRKDSPIYFKQAIDSLLGQSYQNVRIYIGIDGPVDGELKQLLEQSAGNTKIQLCWFKENRGLACVLNDLIAEARKDGFEYYARMDADDISEKTRFERQLKFLQEHPRVDVVGGAIEEIDGESEFNGKRVVYPLTHEDCRRFFRYRDPLAHPAVMFRSSYFNKVKSGYRNEYRKNQDTMLWYDGFMNGCVFANLPETVLYFRVASDFYNRRNGIKRAKQMLRDRLTMNRNLHYDISANLFAIAMFCMTISPFCIKKILYRIR